MLYLETIEDLVRKAVPSDMTFRSTVTDSTGHIYGVISLRLGDGLVIRKDIAIGCSEVMTAVNPDAVVASRVQQAVAELRDFASERRKS